MSRWRVLCTIPRNSGRLGCNRLVLLAMILRFPLMGNGHHTGVNRAPIGPVACPV